MRELPPQYNPQDVEEARYQWWEAQGLFQADPDPSRPSYTIVIPPPNVTGILHMGHAPNSTIQDIIIRAKRMQGYNAPWVPGTDHAGTAPQNVGEKALEKEGKRRQGLGREALILEVARIDNLLAEAPAPDGRSAVLGRRAALLALLRDD